MYDKRICASCKYSEKLNEDQPCCMYIVIEKRRRGCYDTEFCDKYVERTEQRKAQISLEGGIYYGE